MMNDDDTRRLVQRARQHAMTLAVRAGTYREKSAAAARRGNWSSAGLAYYMAHAELDAAEHWAHLATRLEQV